MSEPSALKALEQVAREVLQVMKATPELAGQKAAVIGGLAVWKYMPNGRSTQDVDFVITLDGPKSVRPILLALKDSPFVERAQYFYYKTSSGSLVQIGFVGQMKVAYFPATAETIKDIQPGSIPYMSIEDLIVSKIFSCGLRGDRLKSNRDATDAWRLLRQKVEASGPLRLEKHQIDAAEPGLDDVVQQTNEDEAWWRTNLGLPAVTKN